MDMRKVSLFLAIPSIGCATPVAHDGLWRYGQLDHSGCVTTPPGDVAELVRVAEAAFRASPPAPFFRVPIQLRQACRRSDGRRFLMFYFGSSDQFAVYVFNTRSDIVDRYVHSYWGRREGYYDPVL